MRYEMRKTFNILLLILFSVLLSNCDSFTSREVLFIIPCNYSGRLTVEFDCQNASLPVNDTEGKLVLKFNENGRCVTKMTVDEFVKYNQEFYKWSCEEKVYKRGIGKGRIGPSWTGGVGKPTKTIDTDTIVAYENLSTLYFYCTYVYADEKMAKKVYDSLKTIKCDCDNYGRQEKYFEERCN